MSRSIIPLQYEGQPVAFSDDGWLHATQLAERFGKNLRHWLDSPETLAYVCALDEFHNPSSEQSGISNVRNSAYLKARRGNGGGTWLHPRLAVQFARWLDARFAVWCDLQISDLLYSVHPARERLLHANARLGDCRDRASEGGRALARWRWDRPQLEREVEHWCSQLQLLPGRGGRQEPDHGA